MLVCGGRPFGENPARRNLTIDYAKSQGFAAMSEYMAGAMKRSFGRRHRLTRSDPDSTRDIQ